MVIGREDVPSTLILTTVSDENVKSIFDISDSYLFD